MYYYKTVILLGGNTLNQVNKTVSAPEFLILQVIHGSTALTQVIETSNEVVNHSEERQRLRDVYDSALSKQGDSVDSMFGRMTSLPDRLPKEVLETLNLDLEEKDIIDRKALMDIAKSPESRDVYKTTDKTLEEQEREERIISSEEVVLNDILE